LIELTIRGNTPSKKNKMQIIYVRGRPLVIPSRLHKDWHAQAIPQLYGIKPARGQIGAVELIFYPSSKRKNDLTNKAESIMDLLVDAGIIEDDNWWIVPKVTLTLGGIDKLHPRAEIKIYDDISGEKPHNQKAIAETSSKSQ
jgi:hypothetical protein